MRKFWGEEQLKLEDNTEIKKKPKEDTYEVYTTFDLYDRLVLSSVVLVIVFSIILASL